MKRLIAVRKSSRVFGRGTMTVIRPANRSVLVYVRQYEDEVILCVANLSRSAQAAEIDLGAWRGRVPYELLGRTPFPRIGEGPYVITLAPYGFFWFALQEEAEGSADIKTIHPEFVTLVMGDGWRSLAEGRGRSAFEREVLPGFLASRRWFSDKGTPFIDATCQGGITLEGGDPGIMLALVDFTGGRGSSRYTVPLAVKWSRFDRLASSANIVAAVRRYAREGTLVDASTDPEFVSVLLRRLHAGDTIFSGDRRIVFRPTEAFTGAPMPVVENVINIDGEQSNTTAIADEKFVVKLLRRLQPGIHPEAEMGRFLTDTVQYRNAPLFLGAMELHENNGVTTLAVAHAFVQNQGDAWTVTSAYLDRYIDEQRLLPADAPAGSDELNAFVQRMRQIGRRTAELQNALASRPDIADFAPEPVTPKDVARWTAALVRSAEATFGELQRRRLELSETNRNVVDLLVAQRQEIVARLAELLPPSIQALNIRHHGDLHLGQILFAKDDAYIIDFEGEPQRRVEERREKAPAARDVAGLVRSIDYASSNAFERVLTTWSDEQDRLVRALDHWGRQSVDAFMSSYQETLTNPDMWPAGVEEATRLLDFFLFEKALYEINYELLNRPNWLRVPLLGLQRILSQRAWI